MDHGGAADHDASNATTLQNSFNLSTSSRTSGNQAISAENAQSTMRRRTRIVKTKDPKIPTTKVDAYKGDGEIGKGRSLGSSLGSMIAATTDEPTKHRLIGSHKRDAP